MPLKLLLLTCILMSTSHMVSANEACQLTVDSDGQQIQSCAAEYICIEDSCVHKGLYPLNQREIIGTVFIVLVLGLANVGGSGGGAIANLILLTFFNFSENKAIMGGYALVFGGDHLATL